MGFQKYYVIIRVGHGKCLRLLTRWVGGVKKGPKNAYVIFEWSLGNHQCCQIFYWSDQVDQEDHDPALVIFIEA